ncbi:MAG: hypothetical protein MJZ63_04390 [Muribaculaceae bacterium]|nr:hypothetical protein [Muribaculaceae bacterium]
MVKRLLFAAVCILMCVSAIAEDKPINAVCIKLKPGAYHDKAISAQFITSPEISYSEDGETLTLTCSEETWNFNVSNIEEMVFIHSDDIITGITDILNEQFPATRKAVEGIFTINGVKLDRITSPGIYIVNGRKVLVK